jgi:decaprenyl-phosphate phosphoribosyltransferase
MTVAVSPPQAVAAVLRLLRPHQWVKNAFLAGPLLFTPAVAHGPAILDVALGILCFCAIASAVYVLNDVIDAESDRQHPTKRRRPIASGRVGVKVALAVGTAVGLAGLGEAWLLGSDFFRVAVTYLSLNTAYTLWFKRVAILDVMCIAASFILRIYAGSALIAFPPGVWILLCTGLLALFLALAKRRDDIVRQLDSKHRRSLDGYNKGFLDAALAVILSALLVSYVIYTTDHQVIEKLGTDKLYTTIPFVVGGVLRYLQLTLVMERSGSPTTLLLTDLPLLATVLAWVGACAALIYF